MDDSLIGEVFPADVDDETPLVSNAVPGRMEPRLATRDVFPGMLSAATEPFDVGILRDRPSKLCRLRSEWSLDSLEGDRRSEFIGGDAADAFWDVENSFGEAVTKESEGRLPWERYASRPLMSGGARVGDIADNGVERPLDGWDCRGAWLLSFKEFID